MPKLKTKKAAAKRFKITASGKVKRTRAFTSHLMSNKDHKNKRNLRGTTVVAAADAKVIKKCFLVNSK
ncbi:MAG: 50S ribosomal protein L35 [Alphaproteobacteria bacterium]|jgi:large subunit ribosomal protein L35|nr:50S ribosomal protein L35 [Alphaproteobacteria bacterium]MCV6599911.1 50S ribosomal protein L35 [Alphaproteobacteria bacterium]